MLRVKSPWLLISGQPRVRIDLRFLDRVESSGRFWKSVRLVCGDLKVELDVRDAEIYHSRYRSMSIHRNGTTTGSSGTQWTEKVSSREQIDRIVGAHRLVRAAADRPDVDHFVTIGDDVVRQRGDYVEFGLHAFRIDEVRYYAKRGANLPLSAGPPLQAALALLVVAATAEADRRAPPRSAST